MRLLENLRYGWGCLTPEARDRVLDELRIRRYVELISYIAPPPQDEEAAPVGPEADSPTAEDEDIIDAEFFEVDGGEH